MSGPGNMTGFNTNPLSSLLQELQLQFVLSAKTGVEMMIFSLLLNII